jgi:multiple sugar transport system permease protein
MRTVLGRALRFPLVRSARWARNGGLSSLLFVLPLLVIFGVFSWGPITQAGIMSFQHTNLVTAPEWVGWANFVKVFHDPNFMVAVKNTGYFAVLALVFGYPVPLVAAVVMSEARRARGAYGALAYLPVVVPPVVSVLLWKFFYSGSATGVFNSVLGWVGIGPQPWIQSATQSMPALVLAATWAGAGSTVIIYLAALKSVPATLYEAAELDGAGILRKVWHVTMPHLRGVLFITLILQLIATSQVFLEPFLFTGGGPANATLTILLLIYRYAFTNSLGGDYGAATALSLMLAAFLAVMSLLYFRLTKRWSM